MEGCEEPGVDGMDALAPKQACKFGKEYAVKNGPIDLQGKLYERFASSLFLRWTLNRYHGHSMSDPGRSYRTRDEISGVRQDIEKEVRKEVDEAIA
ncbi:hypothetical protein QJS10_CPB20g00307 [Acorus calamus]|uniref:Dehydrogenase E1 component domain-containing protein n=1 Tax=Acorus calamus TaxID=4465 RepID=A0AAV9CC45_ACOCL|nr:hypothetical protein QJS10_CPB20g00307 [Acorus calamus]